MSKGYDAVASLAVGGFTIRDAPCSPQGHRAGNAKDIITACLTCELSRAPLERALALAGGDIAGVRRIVGRRENGCRSDRRAGGQAAAARCCAVGEIFVSALIKAIVIWSFYVDGSQLSGNRMGALPENENRHLPRLHDRQTVLIGVRVRRKGESWFKSRITDMSLEGFRLMSFVKLQIGMELWVMFPGFEGRKASVVWIADHEVGCAFENPLHPAIFDYIIRMSDLRGRD